MIEKTIKKVINELTSSRYGGYYTGPLTMGEIDWEDSSMGPFTKKVSKYFNSELEYDSYDGSMDSHKKNIKKIESKSKRISNYNKNHKQFNDEDGNPINATPGKGKKIVPIKEWVDLYKIPLNEDLAVWFGTKKNLKEVNNLKVHGLIFVEKSMVNIRHVVDLMLLLNHILNVVRQALQVKCQIHKKRRRVNKKEMLRKKILKQEKVKNLL